MEEKSIVEIVDWIKDCMNQAQIEESIKCEGYSGIFVGDPDYWDKKTQEFKDIIKNIVKKDANKEE